MTVDSKGRELFIVDNSVSGWTGLQYLEEWSSIAKAFDIATGYFGIGALLALDGKWQELDKTRILMGAGTTHRTRNAILKAVRERALDKLDKSIEADKVIPFQPRTVDPAPGERYATAVLLFPLKAAAGVFSDSQHIQDDDFEWVAVKSRHRLSKGMFVAQVVGKSMEPAIHNNAWCLFHSPVKVTRQGKIVIVQLRDTTDPETGQRYTVKRYKSEKAKEGDSWRHENITPEPVNPNFEPIVLTGADEDQMQVIAELIEVLEG